MTVKAKSPNNAERKIILQRQRIVELLVLFCTDFMLGHLLARRKDGELQKTVIPESHSIQQRGNKKKPALSLLEY